MNNYCANCGKASIGTKNFCAACGTAVSATSKQEPLLIVNSGIATRGLRVTLVIFGISSFVLGITQIYNALFNH